MRKTARLLISISVLVMMIGAIFFAGKPQPSSAQNAPFRSYQLRVHCDDPATATFWQEVDKSSMEVDVRCAGNCPGEGFVTLAEALAGLPANVSATFKAMLEKHEADAAAGKGSRLACLGDGKKPPEDKKPKCEPPPNSPQPPWFNPDIPCRDRTKGTISWKHVLGTRDRSYTVKMCGEVISYTLPGGAGRGFSSKMPPGVRLFDVCCDSWRNAANTKSPCDARLDIDCDGQLNRVDRFAEIPEKRLRPSDFFVYYGPAERPTAHEMHVFNSLHAPDQSECKDCKWELVRYETTCKNVPNLSVSDRTGLDVFDAEHKVKATWKCPATGQTKENEETVTVQYLGCPRP